LVSLAAAVRIVLPLLTACVAPLRVLAYTSVRYDLRLRREGYAAVTQDGQAAGTEAMPVG
jgi:hypothetical protein